MSSIGTHNFFVKGITYYCWEFVSTNRRTMKPRITKGRAYIHTTVTLSAELKADNTYIVKANFNPDRINVLNIEVVDKKMDKVVSRNLNTHFKHKQKMMESEPAY